LPIFTALSDYASYLSPVLRDFFISDSAGTVVSPVTGPESQNIVPGDAEFESGQINKGIKKANSVKSRPLEFLYLKKNPTMMNSKMPKKNGEINRVFTVFVNQINFLDFEKTRYEQ
jgi:hypothetical protein